MISILSNKELLVVSGGDIISRICPDGFEAVFPRLNLNFGEFDPCAGHYPPPPPPLPPTCSCLDYNDTPFGGSGDTMDACWTGCCTNSGGKYHAAKFGKYSRDC